MEDEMLLFTTSHKKLIPKVNNLLVRVWGWYCL